MTSISSDNKVSGSALRVAVLSTVVLLVTGHFILSLLIGATYFLGGTGVRERSFSAAVLVFACYLVDKLATMMSRGAGNPLIGVVALMLLFANVRATFLSKRWHDQDAVAAKEEMPERSSTSFADKFANKMPAIVWPKMRFVFYPVASLLLVMQFVGIVVIARTHSSSHAGADPQSTQQIQVTPQ